MAVGGVKADVEDEDFAAASDVLQHDAGESMGSLKKIQTYGGWHYVRVFAAFALYAFHTSLGGQPMFGTDHENEIAEQGAATDVDQRRTAFPI